MGTSSQRAMLIGVVLYACAWAGGAFAQYEQQGAWIAGGASPATRLAPGVCDRLRAGLAAEDAAVRRSAAACLALVAGGHQVLTADSRPDWLAECLRGATRDADAWVRLEAAKGLWRLEQPRTAPGHGPSGELSSALHLLLNEDDPPIRRALAQWLAGEATAGSMGPALPGILFLEIGEHVRSDTDQATRESLALALARSSFRDGGQQTNPGLEVTERLLLEGDVECRRVLATHIATSAWNRSQSSPAADLVVRRLREDPDESVRAAILAALNPSEVGHTFVTHEQLLEVLKSDPCPEVLVLAARRLCGGGDAREASKAVEGILAAAPSPAWTAVARVLAGKGTPGTAIAGRCRAQLDAPDPLTVAAAAALLSTSHARNEADREATLALLANLGDGEVRRLLLIAAEGWSLAAWSETPYMGFAPRSLGPVEAGSYAIEASQPLLAHADPAVRCAALRGLQRRSIGAQRASATDAALADPAEEVRLEGLRLALSVGSRQMSDTEKLRSTLDRLVGNDPSPSVRGAAARALLGYPGPDGADDLLARLLEHPEPQVRADVCSLISGRRIVANGFEAQLRGLLGDAAAVAPPASLDWRFPPDAEWMGALGRRVIPDRPAVTVGEAAFAALLAVTASTREQSRLAVDCLADPDGPTADRALRALNSVSVEYLAGRLEDPDPRVRAACARGAAALGPTAVSLAPALRRLLHDPERSVRLEAVRAVDILGAAVGDAEPDLVAMIPSGDGEMDLAACGALMTANALPMVLRPSGVLPQPAWGF